MVDFKVVAVTEVANSNCMEKKGFMDTLSNLEANGIKVDIISTDRHPQIKKEIRVNHPNIDHQFDPWHISKSVSKTLMVFQTDRALAGIINYYDFCLLSVLYGIDICLILFYILQIMLPLFLYECKDQCLVKLMYTIFLLLLVEF